MKTDNADGEEINQAVTQLFHFKKSDISFLK